MRSSLPPSLDATPIPPCYDLETTLRLLGLNNLAMFTKSGLRDQIKVVSDRHLLFDPNDVQRWAKRLARLRIRAAWGEVTMGGRGNRLLDAPTDAERDTVCPRCGDFAQSAAGPRPHQVRCIQGHVSPRPRGQAATPPTRSPYTKR